MRKAVDSASYLNPWLAALEALRDGLSASCRRDLTRRAAYATRDFVWRGLDNWDRHGRGLQRRCPELGADVFALDAPSL